MGNSGSKKEPERNKSPKNLTPAKSPQNVKPVKTPQTAPVPFVAPPQPFLSLDDFFKNWHLWKQSFLQYKSSIEGSAQIEWHDTLLNLMGPIGQQIFALIKSPYQRMNLTMLIQEFDEYNIFEMKRRLPRESIFEYMDELQTIVRNKNLQHGEHVIKHRILAEINEQQFTDAAKKLIPTFVFSSTYNTLTLKQIAFLWDFYMSETLCRKCGNDHGPDNCPAIGKQCHRCNKLDHYSRRCPSRFMFQCDKCGGSHNLDQCPAFNETCTKCHREHHFYWKCKPTSKPTSKPRSKPTEILQCRFCGMCHIAARSACPAINTFCTYCNSKGHFSSRCNRKPRTARY